MNYSQLDGDALLRTEEVANWLNVSKSFLDKARVAGKGPAYIKIDKNVRYRVSALREWMRTIERRSTRAGLVTSFDNDASDVPEPEDIIYALS